MNFQTLMFKEQEGASIKMQMVGNSSYRWVSSIQQPENKESTQKLDIDRWIKTPWVFKEAMAQNDEG